MELKLNRETLSVSECIYDGLEEQSVELDYILPDYCPDIFKMVRCSIEPSITTWSLNDNSLSYELLADVRILYISENAPGLQCINQKMLFNKSLKLEEAGPCPLISLVPKTDHINCRVVNQRRIDMRGAVSIKIHVLADRSKEVICDIFGMNVQCRKIPVEMVSKKLSAYKPITVSEELKLNSSNLPVISIAKVNSSADITDKKIISNKLVLKGEIKLNILYSCEDGLETMRYTLPFSQIVDIEGIDESFLCRVKSDIAACDITPSADETGENRVLKCEIRVNLTCLCTKTLPSYIVSDAYSTTYPCEYASSKIKLMKSPMEISDSFSQTAVFENDGNSFECVYDAWCTPKNVNISFDKEEKTVKIAGMNEYSVMIKSENGMPAVLEKSEAFEQKLPLKELTEGSEANIVVIPSECTYTITSQNSISVKADMKIKGELTLADSIEAVTDLSINEDVKITRDGDYALKLYYGVEGEDIWEIAKRYSTSVKAIMEENDLESELLSDSGMLLIPIV